MVLQDSAALAGQIVTLTGGKMVATWISVDATARGTIKGQSIDASGHPIGTAFEISAAHVGSEAMPDVVALPDGGFAVSWIAASTLVARIFDANGLAKGNDFAIVDTGAAFYTPDHFGLTVSGRKLIGFASGSNAGQHAMLLGEVFGTGSTLGETWNGSPLVNNHNGTQRDGRLNGLTGNDTLNGLAGNETLNGLTRNNIMTGGAGVDVINGGAGRHVIRGLARCADRWWGRRRAPV